MGLPISRSQFDKLGKRLAKAPQIVPEDLNLLERVYEAYAVALRVTQGKLARLGYTPVVRLKTTGTLVDKLRRSPGLAISHIHDIAGARIVVDAIKVPAGTTAGSWRPVTDVELKPGRRAQTIHAMMIMDHLTAPGSRPAELTDRRLPGKDSHGYRAVHVVAYLDGIPVEIQLRTPLQHAWAEIVERLGDRWGRGFRYGLDPEDPDRPVTCGSDIRRRDIVALLSTWSNAIDEYEETAKQFENLELLLASQPPGGVHDDVSGEVARVRETLDLRHEDMSEKLTMLLEIASRLE